MLRRRRRAGFGIIFPRFADIWVELQENASFFILIHPMRLLLLFGLLLSIFPHGGAQSFVTVRPQIRITDFGELYSTFDWDSESTAELRDSLGDSLANVVLVASNEAAWPLGIATLESRVENYEAMAAYRAYHVTTLQEDFAVLLVPFGENRDMPPGLQPGNDFYFIIGKAGTAPEGFSIAPEPASPEPDLEAAVDFPSQLDLITRQSSARFEHLTGRQTGEDEDGIEVQRQSKIKLEGAREVFFTENLLSNTTSFTAIFPGSADPSVAREAYLALIRRIEDTPLSCCGLIKQAEDVTGPFPRQIFTVYSHGEMDAAYQGMVIEVYLEQGEMYDPMGRLVDEWLPAIAIYQE
jgi:hypothetical protein